MKKLQMYGVVAELTILCVGDGEEEYDSGTEQIITAQLENEDGFYDILIGAAEMLSFERCTRESGDGACFCINCRAGGGEIYFDKNVVGYITGSGHAQYEVCRDGRVTIAGSPRSLGDGSEYAVLLEEEAVKC